MMPGNWDEPQGRAAQRIVDSQQRMVSLRLSESDVKFIINELTSCASNGAADEAYRTIPEKLQTQLVKHEMRRYGAG